MRVLIVTNSVSIGNLSGGVEVVSKLHLQALLEVGLSCDLIALNRNSDFESLNPLNRYILPKARRILWKERIGHFSVKFIWMFWRSLSSYDVVHIHLCKDFVTMIALVICRFTHKPFVIQTHGMFLREDRKIDQIFNWVCKKLSGQSSFHLVLTDSENRWFREKDWHTTRIKIRNPVNLPSVLNSSTHKIYDLCFLSRFHVRKRPLMLIEAIKILKDSGHSLRVRMAGSDEGEWALCKAKIRQYHLEDNFDLSGQISSEDIFHILDGSKIMVLPSYSEFVPMIILESLARGVPVICGSDCELAQELNSHRICSLADNPIELATSILNVLAEISINEEISLSGFEWVAKNCSPNEIATKLSYIYAKSIVGEKSP